eukprot:symbB.v1.2.000620.t1/scaffold26.1/size418576/35
MLASCLVSYVLSEASAVVDVPPLPLPVFPPSHPDLDNLLQKMPGHEWKPNKSTAILRSLVAGLSTSLGAGIVLLLRGSPTAAQMAFALALAAGVMLTVSLVELFIPAFFHGQWLQAGKLKSSVRLKRWWLMLHRRHLCLALLDSSASWS